MDKNLQKFLDANAPLIRQARGIRVSAILGRRPKGEWAVLAGRLTTLAETPPVGVRRKKQSGELLGLSVSAGPQDMRAVLSALENLCVIFPGCSEPKGACLFKNRPEPPEWSRTIQWPRETSLRHFELDWPTQHIAVEGEGFSAATDKDFLDASVARLAYETPPYSSLHDLALDIGVETTNGLSTSSRSAISLVVPLWMCLHSYDINYKRRTITVAYEARGQVPSDAVVGVIPVGGTPRQRQLARASTFTPGKASRQLRYREFRLPKATGPLAITLSQGGRQVDSQDASLPDVTHAIHEALDPRGKHLAIRLFNPQEVPAPQGEGRHHDRFVEGVLWLFNLMGFRSVSYDPLGPYPDVLCTSADGELLLAIECTTDIPDRKKLKDLRRRAAALRGFLSERNHKAKMQAVLATCRHTNFADLAHAEEDSVLLFGAQQLAGLLAELHLGHSHDYFCEKFRSMRRALQSEDPIAMSTRLAKRLFLS